MRPDGIRAALGTVRRLLAEREGEAVRELADYVRIPSVSAETPAEVRRAADHVCGLAESWGLTARQLSTPGLPMVTVSTERRPDRPTVLVYGHYDVQPAGDVAEWASPPFEAQVRDGRIYGRGTSDNKGQHLAHLLALRAWLDVAGEVPCNVVVLLDGEEEIGSPHLRHVAEQHPDELAADLVVWSDGPVHDDGQATLNFGVRGILLFELHARGADRALHSGAWGGVAPDPGWELVHLLASMRDPYGRITVPGLLESVQPLSGSEWQALAALPVDVPERLASVGLDRLAEPSGRGFYERLAAWPTLTINGFLGDGRTPRTIVPPTAGVRCDVRLVAGMTVARTDEAVRRHVARTAPGIGYRCLAGMEPSRTDLDSPWVAPLAAAVRSSGLGDPLLVPAMGGSLPDHVFTGVMGLPSIGMPFANPDESNHAPDENLELDRLHAGSRAAAAMVAFLAHPDLAAAADPP